ncbi:MAG: polysaccharide biosynthesis C-terminal domain-containing protein [Thermoleophilaceae bacterium]|nr:polysaccharide biosynthesis C-terminal domain-containing protein [Thermoleophilaceae bacterium]
MIDYLKRLLHTGSAYTVSSVLAKLFAVFTLPLYTKYLTPVELGQAEILAISVVVASIILRGGMIEALLRFHHRYPERQKEVARTAFWSILVGVTLGAALFLALVPQLSQLLLQSNTNSAESLVRIAILGLWLFTFYELLLAFFRIEEHARGYATATIINVLITIPLTIWLVVIRKQGASGYLLGNYIGTGIIVVALLYVQRNVIGRPGVPMLREMAAFGRPTVPAEVSLYALNFADRLMLAYIPSSRLTGYAYAGLYSVAAKLAQGVTVFVRAFQLAWPPLAYSIKSDQEASKVYGRVLTYYLLVMSAPLAFLALNSRMLADFLVAPKFFQSYQAIPLLATGVALYGAYLVLVTAVARTGKTRAMFPIALTGLAVNIALCWILIPSLNIRGAGLSLIGAYLVILSLMYLRARRAIGLDLEWQRLIHIVLAAGAVILSGSLLLPTEAGGWYLARVAWLGLYPLLLLVTGFFSKAELQQLRTARQLLKRSSDAEALPDGPALVEQMHDGE